MVEEGLGNVFVSLFDACLLDACTPTLTLTLTPALPPSLPRSPHKLTKACVSKRRESQTGCSGGDAWVAHTEAEEEEQGGTRDEQQQQQQQK